jgi:hypothetical protein
MHRVYQVQPLSLILGITFSILCFVTMGQASVNSNPLVVQYMPHPREMVQIGGLNTYTVPTGKLFVLTGLGTSRTGIGGTNIGQVSLRVNGLRSVSALATLEEGNGASMKSIPMGLALGPGSVLDVVDQNDQLDATFFAWGYLAKQ